MYEPITVIGATCADTPNQNGVTFSRACVESMVKQINDRKDVPILRDVEAVDAGLGIAVTENIIGRVVGASIGEDGRVRLQAQFLKVPAAEHPRALLIEAPDKFTLGGSFSAEFQDAHSRTVAEATVAAYYPMAKDPAEPK